MSDPLGFELREVIAHRAVTILNEMLRADELATRRLVEARVPCNLLLAEHPTVQVGKRESAGAFEKQHEVGLLGVINGMTGLQWRVAAVMDDAQSIVRFEAVEYDEEALWKEAHPDETKHHSNDGCAPWVHGK